MSVNARITNISRGSLHDGPGVRTVVYLKGCSLRCRWCHNPETFFRTAEVLYAPMKCIGCGRCLNVCPKCHVLQDGEHTLLRGSCTGCGRCAEECPSGALSMSAKEMTAEEVLREIRKDRHFYARSGGGVTLSGGECLLQPEFSAELLRLCREEGIHTAMETALFVPWENAQAVLPYTDLVFADLKLPDAVRHREYTRQENGLILENLRKLTRVHDCVTIRIPLICGVNDSLEDMQAFAAVIDTMGEGLREVELLKYNPLAEGKYQMLGAPYTSFGREAQSNERADALVIALQSAMNHPARVFVRK